MAHGPSPLFHPVEGRGDCLGCHATGKVGARILPAVCAPLPSESCLGCHPSVTAPAAVIYGGGSGFLLLALLGLWVVLARARLVAPGRERRKGPST